jgi:hypothetical protein
MFAMFSRSLASRSLVPRSMFAMFSRSMFAMFSRSLVSRSLASRSLASLDSLPPFVCRFLLFFLDRLKRLVWLGLLFDFLVVIYIILEIILNIFEL